MKNTYSILCQAKLNHTVPTDENKAIVNIGNRNGSLLFFFLVLMGSVVLELNDVD